MLLWGSFIDPGVVIDCAFCSYCINDITTFISFNHSLPVDIRILILSNLNTTST